MSVTVDVQEVDISPNNCVITDPLNLRIKFAVDKQVENANWEVKYMVDMASSRQMIELGTGGQSATLTPGVHEFNFSVPKIDVSGVKQSVLLNVGLLLACLKSGSDEVIQVSMVTQVAKDKSGQLMRTIFSPLE
eukprot:TRINITY_DN21500_c0_g1::TRINITY_DN21500_c0_g1_i1::g.10029::m.10029 TRINITY_DN21500_c0_g1::TRINITY_DN21500_c0_g1_i1::g.10029  ORF type:complete len:157 (-),score=30.46,ASF1_hist_chap/PF04729.8/1.4e-09 TRINITY_DN21500_c0_g1_i1:3-404(-)